MIVTWSSEAIADLVAIRAFVSEDNPTAAQRLVSNIMVRVETALTTAPNLGRAGRVLGTRELVMSGTPFIVPYRLQKNNLQVLRVYHAARRWPEML